MNENYFTESTLNYLYESFKKVNFTENDTKEMLKWLSKAPKWTTIRVNKCLNNNIEEALNLVKLYVNNSFNSLNTILAKTNETTRKVPECRILSDLINECIILNCSNGSPQINQIKKQDKIAIIDLKCAQSILRGADLFIVGIVGLSFDVKQGDLISIFADLNGKCLKGSDANEYFKLNSNSLLIIANGWSEYSRDDIFKETKIIKSGVGIKIKELADGNYIPSFDRINEKIFYLQNLPSIICARVLDPKDNETILDMCAAPGGKTTHLAALVNNKCKILAFDKIASKINKLKIMCNQMNATCIQCICQDGTKIDFDVYKPETFDKILVDVPCSALGQRPLIFNDITIKQLSTYVNYQKSILENAVKLLKPGGILVYSTCTITLEENEEQISWLINKHKNLKIITQEPFYLSSRRGFEVTGLGVEQGANLLQRFLSDANCLNDSVYSDTNGFFIAKILKTH